MDTYGFCTGEDDWWSGRLLAPCDQHEGQYMIVAGHVSSTEWWSEHDIREFHNTKMFPESNFIWLGNITTKEQLEELCPATICTKADHKDDKDDE